MFAIRRVINGGFLLVLAMLVGDAVITYANFLTVAASAGRVDHTRRVVVGLEHTLSVLKDAETGQRGYLLTGDDRYLEPFHSASAELDRTLDDLGALTADNRQQQSRVADLRRLASEKMDELRQTVSLRREQGLNAALAVVKSGRGIEAMDRARRVAAEMQGEEDRLLKQRSAAARTAVATTITSFAAATGMALLLLLAVSWLKRRDDLRRERTAEAIRQSESWLSTTLTSIGDAVIATDGEGRVRFLNPIAEALTGWTQGDAAGRALEDVFVIVNETTRLLVESPVERVIREGVIVGLANHTIVIARDGTETAIEDSAAPIKDQSGSVIGVVMVFQDATERRRYESAIRESEERLRLMVESVKDYAIFSTDPEGRVTTWNAGAERVFGYRDDEILGANVALIFTTEDRAQGAPRLELAKAEDVGRAEDERWHVRKDGTRFFATGVVTPVRDKGLLRGFTKVARDITERKQIEEELRAARDEAEHANKAKDRFLAVLSHELRTPLNPILLAATSMLERPPDPVEVRPTLEMIRQNVMLQSRLIDDLLDVMRIVRGKMPLHWEVADCHSLIRQSVQICQSEVFGKELQLEMDLGAQAHFLNADAARLQQVFWNLVKNAVKFTPGGGSITIRTRNEENAGVEHLVIEVRDTGIGIDPDILPLIFDPFQQGETKITRKFGGLGLGLAICRGIVESHGGTLTAESPGEGQGTTFQISMTTIPGPLATSGEPAVGEPIPPLPVPTSLKLLIVEDEPATLRLMAKLLRGLGHVVTTAGTIAAAQAAAEANDFDLIVSDIGLPDGSGLELMRQVVHRRGPVPAIALTGYGMEEDIQRSREAGFTAHLTKPIDFTKLEAMIRRVVPAVA